MSLSLLNDILDSCINLLQNRLDSRGGLGNFSFNNSLDFVQEVKNVVFDFSRFNLGFDLVEDIFQVLGSFHDVSEGDVFLGLELVSKVSKMFANGGDKVLNSMLEGGLQNIIQKIVKNIVTSNVVLELSNLSNDGFQKINKEAFSRFNTILSFLDDILYSGINFLQDGLDSGSGSSNLGINNSLDFVQEVNDVVLNFSRDDLGFDLIKDVFQVSNSFHDFSDGEVFTGNQLSNEVPQVLLDGWDKIFDSLSKSRLQDIIEKIIKDVVSSDLVLQFSQFGHDLLQKLDKETLSLLNSSINVSLSLGNHFINGGLDLLKSILDNRFGLSNLGLNNSLQLVQEVNKISFDLSRLYLGFELIENFLDVLSNFHDVRDSHEFSWLQLVSQISKMLTNGGDEVLNGMFQGGFEDIIKEIIKDTISGQLILQFSKFGQDLIHELNKETFSSFNTSFSISFSLGNHFINSSLDLFQSSLDNWLVGINFGFNDGSKFVEEINNVGLNFSRLNLTFKFIEEILDALSNFNDVSQSHIFNIFIGHKLSNEIPQVL